MFSFQLPLVGGVNGVRGQAVTVTVSVIDVEHAVSLSLLMGDHHVEVKTMTSMCA